MCAELAQQACAEGVDGPARDLLRGRTQTGPQPLRDLAGGLVGERERADPPGPEAVLFNQETDSLGQAKRLSGAGSGKHEEGAGHGFDGLPLGGRGIDAGGFLRRHRRVHRTNVSFHPGAARGDPWSTRGEPDVNRWGGGEPVVSRWRTGGEPVVNRW